MTHHLPVQACVLPQFESDPFNRFFVCDLGDLIERSGPPLWIHGHTHGCVDLRIGRTRVVCNPVGYGAPWHNRGFDKALVLDVEPRDLPPSVVP